MYVDIDTEGSADIMNAVMVDDFSQCATVLKFDWVNRIYYDFTDPASSVKVFGCIWDVASHSITEIGTGQYRYTFNCYPANFCSMVDAVYDTVDSLCSNTGYGEHVVKHKGDKMFVDYSPPIPFMGTTFGSLIEHYRRQSWDINLEQPDKLQWLYYSHKGMRSQTLADLDALSTIDIWGEEMVGKNVDQNSVYNGFEFSTNSVVSTYLSETFPSHFALRSLFSYVTGFSISCMSMNIFTVGLKYRLHHPTEKLIDNLDLNCLSWSMSKDRDQLYEYKATFGKFDFSTKEKPADPFYGAGLPVSYSGKHETQMNGGF